MMQAKEAFEITTNIAISLIKTTVVKLFEYSEQNGAFMELSLAS